MKHPIWFALILFSLIEIFSILPLRVVPEPSAHPGFVTGAIHVPFSRGGSVERRIESLTQAARDAGLDFMVLAGLNQKVPTDLAGHFNGVDLFAEIEVETPAGHAVLFHSQTHAADWSVEQLQKLAWNHFLGDQSKPGLFMVVAHPSSWFRPWERLDRFADGKELINFRALIETQAFERPLGALLTVLLTPLNPYLAALRLYTPDPRDITAWDAVNALAPGHFGVVATDDLAHWPWIQSIQGALPGWRQALRAATNVVFPEEALSDDFKKRRRQIYRSLKEGRSALVLQAIHPFEGNDWALVCGNKQYRSGDKFALREAHCQFEVRLPPTLPYPVRLRLLRDGEVMTEIERASSFEKMPVLADGAYRLEVWVQRNTLFRVALNREVPYLLYNPLYVR